MKLKPSTQWPQAPHRLGFVQRPGTECPPDSGHSETARPRTLLFATFHPRLLWVQATSGGTRNLHMLWIWNRNSLSSWPLLLWSSSLKLSRTFSFWSSQSARWSKTGPATGCCRKLVWRQVLILDTFACLTSIVPYVLSEVSFRIIQFDFKGRSSIKNSGQCSGSYNPCPHSWTPKIFYTAPFVVIGMLNNCIEWLIWCSDAQAQTGHLEQSPDNFQVRNWFDHENTLKRTCAHLMLTRMCLTPASLEPPKCVMTFKHNKQHFI